MRSEVRMLLHKILVSGSAHGLAWREGPRGGGDGSGRSSDLFRPIHVELSWNEIVVQGLTILIEGSGADMAAPSEREEKGHSSRERRREREELIRREREEKGHSSSPATGPQPFTRTHLLVLSQVCMIKCTLAGRRGGGIRGNPPVSLYTNSSPRPVAGMLAAAGGEGDDRVGARTGDRTCGPHGAHFKYGSPRVVVCGCQRPPPCGRGVGGPFVHIQRLRTTLNHTPSGLNPNPFAHTPMASPHTHLRA